MRNVYEVKKKNMSTFRGFRHDRVVNCPYFVACLVLTVVSITVSFRSFAKSF